MPSSYDSPLIYTSLECVVLAFCTNRHFGDREDLERKFPGGTCPGPRYQLCGWAPGSTLPPAARKAFSKRHTFSLPEVFPGGGLGAPAPLSTTFHTRSQKQVPVTLMCSLTISVTHLHFRKQTRETSKRWDGDDELNSTFRRLRE